MCGAATDYINNAGSQALESLPGKMSVFKTKIE